MFFFLCFDYGYSQVNHDFRNVFQILFVLKCNVVGWLKLCSRYHNTSRLRLHIQVIAHTLAQNIVVGWIVSTFTV